MGQPAHLAGEIAHAGLVGGAQIDRNRPALSAAHRLQPIEDDGRRGCVGQAHRHLRPAIMALGESVEDSAPARGPAEVPLHRLRRGDLLQPRSPQHFQLCDLLLGGPGGDESLRPRLPGRGQCGERQRDRGRGDRSPLAPEAQPRREQVGHSRPAISQGEPEGHRVAVRRGRQDLGELLHGAGDGVAQGSEAAVDELLLSGEHRAAHRLRLREVAHRAGDLLRQRVSRLSEEGRVELAHQADAAVLDDHHRRAVPEEQGEGRGEGLLRQERLDASEAERNAGREPELDRQRPGETQRPF